jgi:hypothetical protein
VSPERAPRVALFADLGVYRVLAGLEETREVEAFGSAWLGGLADYDAERGAALLDSLGLSALRETS